MTSEAPRSSWTFLTNHAHVLIIISRDPAIRQREIAEAVGITLGAVQRIIHELEAEGYISHERVGRRNLYNLDGEKALRHPLESDRSIRDLGKSLR